MTRTPGTRTGGFTLIELMVVIIIIGVLVSVAIPQYTKTMETAKATNAAAKVQLIAAANRMFALDHNHVYASGVFSTSSCSSTTCSSSACTGSNPTACCLQACNYMTSDDWTDEPYGYIAENPSTQTGGCPSSPSACGSATPSSQLVACAQRSTGSTPPPNSSQYYEWGYAMDVNGSFGCYGTGTPAPPQ